MKDNNPIRMSLPKKDKVPVPHFAKPTPTTFGTRWTRGFVLARIVNGQTQGSTDCSVQVVEIFQLLLAPIRSLHFKIFPEPIRSGPWIPGQA